MTGSVVKTGDVVRVRVLEVDVARKRIALSMKRDTDADEKAAPREARPARTTADARPRPERRSPPAAQTARPRVQETAKPANTAMGDAWARALQKREE